MTESSPTIKRFRQLPRAIQWAILAGIGMGLFMIWAQWIDPIADDWDTQAQRIQTRVANVRTAEDTVKDLTTSEMKDLVTALGPVRVPPTVFEGTSKFNKVVLDVLQKHGVTPNLSTQPRGRLSKAALTEVTQGQKRIDRLSGELKFDAKPNIAAAILAELESSPHIESINSVRMTRDAGGKVNVHLSIEAWVLSPESAAPIGESA